MRIPLIAGNWKMNATNKEALELVRGIHYAVRFPKEVEVVVAPPFTALHTVIEFAKSSYIGVAAQNMHEADKGAFTGEVSAVQLKEIGIEYVILGHSERRQYFQETNELINKKIKQAFKFGIVPIYCVGETLKERENGNYFSVIEEQICMGLEGLSQQEIRDLVVAYEPVWAIGTGKVASADQVEEVHSTIRSFIEKNFGDADSTRILYGGSVKPDNCKELMHLPNVDGALVGGASLNASDFVEIIKSID